MVVLKESDVHVARVSTQHRQEHYAGPGCEHEAPNEGEENASHKAFHSQRADPLTCRGVLFQATLAGEKQRSWFWPREVTRRSSGLAVWRFWRIRACARVFQLLADTRACQIDAA